jgi:ABC-2 type transport system permease protein
MPVTLLLIVPYLLALTVVPADPDGLLSSALGLFPLTSPLVMPSLVALGAASALEVALALVLIVPALAFIAWLGGRAYAGAILTNRRTTFRELVGLQSLRGLFSR